MTTELTSSPQSVGLRIIMKLEQFRDLDIGTPQIVILLKRLANIYVRC